MFGIRHAFRSLLSPHRNRLPRLIISTIIVLLFLTSLVEYHTGTIQRSTLPWFETDYDVPVTNEDERVLPKPPQPPSSPVWAERAEKVKQAFVHAYDGYWKYAAPHDELQPLSNRSRDNFNGWGVTAIDSLDTMLLMGLDDLYIKSLEIVKSLNFKEESPNKNGGYIANYNVMFFETVIRYLGGFLAAYAITNDQLLLQKADELAEALNPAFETKSGLPMFSLNIVTGKAYTASSGSLAEIASCQMEWAYLAHLTGKKAHYDKATNIQRILTTANISTIGMLPNRWDLTTSLPWDDRLSLGAGADSAHEYILKYYLLTGRTDPASLDLYLRTTDHILTNLLYLTPERSLLYITDVWSIEPKASHKLEHLSCFLPGLFALGIHSLPKSAFTNDRASTLPRHDLLKSYALYDLHLWAATGLGETCWLMYADQINGLGTEEVTMNYQPSERTHPKDWHVKGGHWINAVEEWRVSGVGGVPPGVEEKLPVKEDDPLKRDYKIRRKEYFLRPETVESMYMLWKATGDVKWRERGWAMFEAMEKHTKVDSGYAILEDAVISPPKKRDEMMSFFLAETLKYLYLLFKDDDPISLDKYVFNTEAHPFPIFSWSPTERRKFNIP
ncbi:glycoside hydrolase [Abortiporus biennis]|nr:glycoside hydrolase [Abortiporus biennis]